MACRGAEDRFTERVARQVRERERDLGVVVKERFHLDLVRKDGTHQQLLLDNLWRLCQARPEGCDAETERYVAHGVEGLEATDAFVRAEMVRPVLKDRQWMENVRRLMADAPPEKAAGSSVVSRPFVADLFVVYVFDLPDGMRMLSRADMDALKLDEERLHELAMANLDRAAPEMAAEALEPGSRIRAMHFGDSYESSRVILHGRWKSIAEGVEGDLVVAAPSRDFVYFTGSREDLPGLRALARRAAAENDHAVSATLLRWKPDGWEALP